MYSRETTLIDEDMQQNNLCFNNLERYKEMTGFLS